LTEDTFGNGREAKKLGGYKAKNKTKIAFHVSKPVSIYAKSVQFSG
jgi:hypothetical protein